MIKCTRPHICTRYKVVAIGVARRAAANLVAASAVMMLASSPAVAQSVATRDAELYAAPGDRAVATVRKGSPIVTTVARGSYLQATVDGWVAAALLGPARDSFALTVKPGGAIRLRATASAQAAIVAELRAGMGLQEVERQGAWVHVRRGGWLQSASVSAASALQPGTSAMQMTNAPAAPAAPDTTRNGLVLTPIASTSLAASPGGAQLGSLAPGARATVTGRERGWVRVRVDGWVREADLSVADTALRGALSAADLRADPDGTAGRLVHWEVQVLAHQIGDPLRKGLSDQEPYLLAQGPAGENALLYLAIPPSLAATARELPDLSRAIITARVRVGRSEPVGIPVLELVTIVGR